MKNRPTTGSAFVVLIGDLVRSRRLGREERARIQAQLKTTFAQVNRDYKESICARFQFTGGDEFQGVLRGAGRVFEVMQRARDAVVPVSVRFGIGIGEISTSLSNQPQAMDGPAFHRAREALEHSQEFLAQACVNSGQRERDEMVNAWLDSLSFIRSGWSDRAREVIQLYARFERLEPVAGKLNISLQAVSKHLRVTGYKAYIRGERALTKLLLDYEGASTQKG